METILIVMEMLCHLTKMERDGTQKNNSLEMDYSPEKVSKRKKTFIIETFVSNSPSPQQRRQLFLEPLPNVPELNSICFSRYL